MPSGGYTEGHSLLEILECKFHMDLVRMLVILSRRLHRIYFCLTKLHRVGCKCHTVTKTPRTADGAVFIVTGRDLFIRLTPDRACRNMVCCSPKCDVQTRCLPCKNTKNRLCGESLFYIVVYRNLYFHRLFFNEEEAVNVILKDFM